MTRVPGQGSAPEPRASAAPSAGTIRSHVASHAAGERSRGGSDWIGLGEASRLLGISEGTLRRWADEGRVSVFTTPGGHRRFSRRLLHGLLPSNRPRRPALSGIGASTERIARAYRRPRARAASAAPAAPAAWTSGLGDAERERFRDRGRRIGAALLGYLDSPDTDERAALLQEACQLSAGHGRESAEVGASLADAVSAFLQFRTPFMQELVALARSRGLDTREATELLVEAEAAMDRLLVATMTGHSLAAGPRAIARP